MSEKICANCGVKVLPNERFCPNCGRKIVSAAMDPSINDNLNKKIEQIELQRNGKIPATNDEERIASQNAARNQRSYIFVPDNENIIQPSQQFTAMNSAQMYPGIGARILAFIIDLVIIFFVAQLILPTFISGVQIPDISNLPEDPNTWTPEQQALFEQAYAVLLNILSIFSTLITVITFIYNFLFHISPAKATIGQLILRFKLVDAETLGSAKIGKILLVDILKSIDLLLLFDLLLSSVNRRPGMYRLSNSLMRITMIKKSFLNSQSPVNPNAPF